MGADQEWARGDAAHQLSVGPLTPWGVVPLSHLDGARGTGTRYEHAC